jgi:class 3 adenylate cyclase
MRMQVGTAYGRLRLFRKRDGRHTLECVVGHPDRTDLPRGTVTLLFTDIEGSTSAARALGPAYPQALARHRELVRGAWEAFYGREVDTAGDGFFVVFGRALDAVAAAAEAQRVLGAEPWPAGGALRVRIGIHTGEPDLGEEGYGLRAAGTALSAGSAWPGRRSSAAATETAVSLLVPSNRLVGRETELAEL